jgi:predicted Holliday junction resolvase-like endonuclease
MIAAAKYGTPDERMLLMWVIVLACLTIAFFVGMMLYREKMHSAARALHEKWRNAELAREREVLNSESKLELQNWKAREEMRIRQDATVRSELTHLGKVTEHLVPWIADVAYDPRDMRFVGSPIDLLVFDGLSSGESVSVIFLEVKSGKNARLTVREERIREAVTSGRVQYRKLIVRPPSA